MTTVHAHIDESIAQARASLRQVAAEQQWALAVGETDPETLEFRKGVTPKSGGARIMVRLEEASATKTRLEFTAHEGFAIRDWGRGGRDIRAILDALGAVKD